jgi:hypothetical protein
MYCYFSSDFPAVIKIDGIYYGSVYDCVKTINVDNCTPFIELCSLDHNQKSTYILLDNNFFSSPPENVILTDLQGGYFIKFISCYKKEGFSVLAQEKMPHAIITVFNDNGYKLSIETPNDFFAKELNVNPKSASIINFTLNGQNLVAISIQMNKILLYVFKIDKQITNIFCRQVDAFNTQNGLTTTENFLDIAKHCLTIDWQLQGDTLVENSRSITTHDKFDLSKLHKNLIPYAFLEHFLVGGDASEYLCDNVKENAKVLKEYLGDYVGVCPPPDFYDKRAVGLIYNVSKNLYKVEYFSFTLQDRKIFNIEKL